MIQNYNDFVQVLQEAGFSMGGGNPEGIYAVISWNWNEVPTYETPIQWHTGNPDTDPWEWRIRVLDEREDVAYGKFFFKKSGYICKAYIPYFLAVRRGETDFDSAYASGTISHTAKRLYTCICKEKVVAVHDLKRLTDFQKEDKALFDKALIELQMKLYITMAGAKQKQSRMGEPYGWSSTVFTTMENFWGEAVIEQAKKINPKEAYEVLKKQVLHLNSSASEKKIKKFIEG